MLLTSVTYMAVRGVCADYSAAMMTCVQPSLFRPPHCHDHATTSPKTSCHTPTRYDCIRLRHRMTTNLTCQDGLFIVLYDEDERVASTAATVFVQRGVANVFMLSGGMWPSATNRGSSAHLVQVSRSCSTSSRSLASSWVCYANACLVGLMDVNVNVSFCRHATSLVHNRHQAGQKGGHDHKRGICCGTEPRTHGAS